VAGSDDQEHVDWRAAQLLGLTEDQAGELFSCQNTLDDLRAMVRGLVESGDVPAQYQNRVDVW